jgi:putative DNA primase/helicase
MRCRKGSNVSNDAFNVTPFVDRSAETRAKRRWSAGSYSISAGQSAITVAGGNRHTCADLGIAALMAANVPFYQRDRKIQRIALVKAKNTNGEIMMVPGIIPVDKATLARALGQVSIWQRFDLRMNRYIRIDPPPAVCEQILAMVGEWPFPPLQGIIQCPTLRRDGSLIDEEGYDEVTGLVLVNSISIPPIPSAPTQEHAEQALRLLLDLLAEFPFVDDPSRAVGLSMLITPVVRGAMLVAPMHLVTAPAPGTGKSYLGDVASMIATGERCAVESAAPEYAETEKRLIGSALSGFPIIALDNVRDGLSGDFFCQIVERPLMNLRALGKSDKHRIPNTFTMFTNGNNASVAEDLVRRTNRAGLDANLEHPETREFKGDPLALVQADRGQYIAAALTIPLAYLAAGKPNPMPPLVSFEDWSHLVREPLIWLGCGDPVATQAALRSEDPRKVEKTQIFEAWKSDIGVGGDRRCTTKEIIDVTETRAPLREALLMVASQRFGVDRKIDPKVLGKWLSAQEGSIAANCKLMVDRADKARPKWYLEIHQGSPS